MAAIDDRTTNLDLPLPNENNELQDDVFRLREAIEDIDGLIFALQVVTNRYSGPEVADCNALTQSGFYATTDATLNGPAGYTMIDGDSVIHLKKLADGAVSDSQIYLSKGGRIWVRHKTATTWGAYSEIWTSGNLVKQANPTDVTAGRMMAVGAFGIGSGSVDAGTTNANSLQLGGFFSYETTEAAAGGLNLPSLGGTGTNARHWQVITQGNSTLRTQIATEVKGVGTTKGRMFNRVFETTWTAWQEMATQASLDAQVSALTARLDEVQSIALAGL